MLRKRTTYAKNKMGKFNRKGVIEIVNYALKDVREFIESGHLFWPVANKTISYVDITGKKRKTKMLISFSRSSSQNTVSIGGFHYRNRSIEMLVDFGSKFDKTSIEHLTWLKNNLTQTVYHEIAHAIRQIDSNTRTIKMPDIMTIKYIRHPLELDANISSVVSLMRDHAKTNNIKINTELFWSILQQFDFLQEAYSTPKWRKIIIKRLHREGIDIK